MLEAGDLGDVEKVIIGHDGDGAGAGWFLDKVVIKPLDKSKNDDQDDDGDDDGEDGDDGAKKYIFVCNRWLDVGEDDEAIERELMRVEKEETTDKGEAQSIR